MSFIANYRHDIIERILSHWTRILFLLFSFIFISSNFIFNREDYPLISVINLSINPICFGIILINCIAFTNKIFIKVISPLSYIGKYSYSIYLFHTVFMALSIHFFISGGVKYYIAYLVFAIVGGIVISKLVEYPFINIREKYFPSKAGKHSRHQVQGWSSLHR